MPDTSRKPGLVETLHGDGTRTVWKWGGQENPFGKCPPITGCPNISVHDESASDDFNTQASKKATMSADLRDELTSLYKEAHSPQTSMADKVAALGQLITSWESAQKIVYADYSTGEVSKVVPVVFDPASVPSFLKSMPALRQELTTLGNEYIAFIWPEYQQAISNNQMSVDSRLSVLNDISTVAWHLRENGQQSSEFTFSQLGTTPENFNQIHDTISVLRAPSPSSEFKP